MAGISSKAAGEKENKKKYNGIEFDNDLDLNTYEAQLRDLDPQVGKWWQIDPKVDEMYMWSTYASNFDNPVRYEDHLGDEPNCCKFLTDIVDGIVEKAVGTWNALTNPGETIKNAFSIGNILTTIADAGTFGLYSDAKSLIYNEPGKYIGGKVFDGVAYAVTDGASKAINFKPPSYVYRALTEGENVEKGLKEDTKTSFDV